jgi:CheY-like chemotaxis protein
MASARSILCIHRDPAQLRVLQEKGFSLITATHGSEGLRLLVSKPVDAVILEYHLGLLDGAAVADKIKNVRPRLPIVMLAEGLELPEGALKSVDALVTSSDGPHFLLEAIQAVLQTKDRLHFDTASAEQADLDMPGMLGFELLSVVRRRFPQISTVAMSGAYVGNEVPFGVIADSFFAKGSESKNLLRTIQGLLLTAPARSGDHYRECAPAWIPRNGNDSKAMPYVVLTCAECLRAFPMNLSKATPGEVIEVPCRSCHSINRYIIQPCA